MILTKDCSLLFQCLGALTTMINIQIGHTFEKQLKYCFMILRYMSFKLLKSTINLKNFFFFAIPCHHGPYDITPLQNRSFQGIILNSPYTAQQKIKCSLGLL